MKNPFAIFCYSSLFCFILVVEWLYSCSIHGSSSITHSTNCGFRNSSSFLFGVYANFLFLHVCTVLWQQSSLLGISSDTPTKAAITMHLFTMLLACMKSLLLTSVDQAKSKQTWANRDNISKKKTSSLHIYILDMCVRMIVRDSVLYAHPHSIVPNSKILIHIFAIDARPKKIMHPNYTEYGVWSQPWERIEATPKCGYQNMCLLNNNFQKLSISLPGYKVEN